MVDNLNDEILVKYLEMIQRVIERMAKNSFQIKTWTATLFAAIVILTYSIINIFILIILLFTVFMFWELDSEKILTLQFLEQHLQSTFQDFYIHREETKSI